jgi:hypothetical protein
MALSILASVALAGAPAAAEDASTGSPTPSTTATIPNLGPQTPGKQICSVSNSNLNHVTGMVATADALYAVEGGVTMSRVEVWKIDPQTCDATLTSHSFTPRNPQDVGVGSDGKLWVADIGDSDFSRDWLTFERVDPAGSGEAVPYRATSKRAISGTAMLLQADDTPIIIANSGGQAVLYRPDGQMQAKATYPDIPTLTNVGSFTPKNTGTDTPTNNLGRLLVTGAAVSPDRSHVVIRTASDAYEFAVGSDGDIVKAITDGEPVITPLPAEQNGQAITYSADGSEFLTLEGGSDPVLRSYKPYVKPAPVATQAASSGGGGGLDFSDITKIATVTGLIGLAAVLVGIAGIIRSRRNGQNWAEDGDDYDDGRVRPRTTRPPRPRIARRPGYDEGRPGPAPVRVGADEYARGDDYDPGRDGGHGPSPARGPQRSGSGHDREGDGGHGSSSHGPSSGRGGGQVYGGGQGGGQSPGASGGGQVYGTPKPQGPGSGGAKGGSGGAKGGSGGVYGRPRRPDDEYGRRGGYGDDNIDL